MPASTPIYATGRVHEAACWAHLRRKFFDVHRAQASPIATEALERIAQLYAIEANVRAQIPAQRCAVRQARARPLLEGMRVGSKRKAGVCVAQVRHQ